MTPVEFPAIRTARRVEGIHYAVRDVVELARQAAAAGKDMIYLNIGDPCQFDFETPAPVVEAITKAFRDGKTSYTASEGLPQALTSIERDAVERKGIRSVQQILVGNGASEPIEILLTSLLEPGDSVLIPRPGYPLYSAILAKLSAKEIAYDLDEEAGWQPDPEQIERLIEPNTRALVLINPNNPTGSIADRALLETMLEIAAKHELLVLSDEIYDQMLLDPVEFTATASIRDDLPIATFGGLSKVWLGPGLRIGWSILSGPSNVVAPLGDAMMRIARARLCASHPVQWAIPAALDGDNAHIREANATLARRRDITVQRLNAIDGWSLVPPRGAFYAFPRIDLGIDDLTVAKRLILEHGVVLVHGSGFGQAPGTQHLRFVFLPQDDLLNEACDRIERFTASL